MIRRPPRSTPLYSSAASDVYKRQGAFDEGVAVEISKWFGDWNPFAEAGYTVQGKSAQLFLKNYMAYNAGVGYQVAESFRPILLVKGSTSPADGASSLLEVRLKLKYQATKHT